MLSNQLRNNSGSDQSLDLDKAIILYQREEPKCLPFKLSRQLTYQLPLLPRMLIYAENLIGIERGRFSVEMPNEFAKIKNLSITMIFMHQKQKELKANYREQQASQAIPLQTWLYRQLEESMHQLAANRVEQLRLAGVATPEDLDLKQKFVFKNKMKALSVYLKDPLVIEKRKKIDRLILISYKGCLTEIEEKSIEFFWDFINESPESYKKLSQFYRLHKQFLSLFKTSLDSQKQNLDQSSVNPAHVLQEQDQIIARLKRNFEEANESVCQTHTERKILDYFLLTIEWKMRVSGNLFWSNYLQQHYQTTLVAVDCLIPVQYEINKQKINQVTSEIKNNAVVQEELKKLKKEIVKVKEKIGALEEYYDRNRYLAVGNLKFNEERKDFKALIVKKKEVLLDLKKKQVSLQKQVPEAIKKASLFNQLSSLKKMNYEDFHREALQFFNFNPSDYDNGYPIRNVQLEHVLEVNEEHVNRNDFYLARDMLVDFTSNDPVAYFINQFAKIDEHLLGHLKPKVEVI